MVGGRQLPSWMLKSSAADQGSISEIKEVSKEDAKEPGDKKASKRRRQIQMKENDAGVPVLENKSHLLKKCEAGNKRKVTKRYEDRGVSDDECDLEKKVDIRVGKKSQQGDGENVLNKCEKSRRKRMSSKQLYGDSDDFCEVDDDGRVDVAERERCQSNAPRRKRWREKDFMEGSHDGVMVSIASDDEITVEDLIRIAEEYINADKEKELQKLQNMKFESDVKLLQTANSIIESDKNLTTSIGNRISVTDNSLSADASVINPLLTGGSITNPINTGDPARDMLDLFLGPLLKTSGQVEREANIMTEKLMFDHQLSQRSQNDTVVEMVPVTQKKSSLKDKLALLLD